MSLAKLKSELKQNSNREKAKTALWFFKTGKGEYGEGQKFLGIDTPTQRKIAKKYTDLNFDDLQELLNSDIHDYCFIALVILIEKYKNCKVSDTLQKKIFDFYIKNSKNINNWDLVDISAPHIVGEYLLDKTNRKILYKFAQSKNLWEKRIAIISTFTFIRNNQFSDTIKISEILLNDKHDLIHKAVGWMLREVGNRDRKIEEIFLKKYYKKMPRTMLRYAIEKFPEDLRQKYLKGLI
ncbi:MAG: DNA alkylation repair protein [Candidatus Pacebacteria bacterium]|nr:DNA alkylation repair protein [Candidatus Paceibacterota bacterium]